MVAASLMVASCRDSSPVTPVEPGAWDQWPWMSTVIASPVVVVTGTSEMQATGVLRVNARFLNPGTDSVRVEHGACSFGVRLREVNNRALMPVVWDNRPVGGACILPLYFFYVPALGSRDVRVADIRASDFVGVVPADDYYVSVVWRASEGGEVRETNAGIITVPRP